MGLWTIALPLDSSAQQAAGAAEQSASDGAAPPTRAECLVAHVETQKAQADGELLLSQQHARVCTNPACPAALVVDCAAWLDELEPRIPSLTFEVRLDGALDTSATIEVDGHPVAEWTNGQALEVNPGTHQVQFTLAPFPSLVHTVLVADGMKFRLVAAEFKSPDPSVERARPVPRLAPVTQAAPTRPVPVLVYPLAGLGVLALGSFVGFSLSGNAEFDRLERSCAPYCSDDQMRPVRTRYLIGDVSLGVSALSIAGAAVLYFTRPTLSPATPTVGFAPVPAGGMATFAIQTH